MEEKNYEKKDISELTKKRLILLNKVFLGIFICLSTAGVIGMILAPSIGGASATLFASTLSGQTYLNLRGLTSKSKNKVKILKRK